MALKRIDGLDGLRGVAAFAVLLSHVFDGAMSNAYLAVDFFFVLSGYVMARRYEEILSKGGASESWSFLRSRIMRLYPLIFVGSVLGLPWLFTVEKSQPWIVAGYCFLLLPIEGTLGAYMLNPPAWSIAFELVANLFHAGLLARMKTRLLAVCGIIIGIALIAATRGRGLGVFPHDGSLLVVLLRVLAPYILGIVLQRCWRDRPPVCVGPVLTWLTMPIVFAVGVVFPVISGFLDYLFVLIFCPLLIAGGLQNCEDNALARFIGRLSFPLYAVHGPVVLSLKYLDFAWDVQLAGGLLAGFGAHFLSLSLSQRGGRRRVNIATA